MTTPNLGLEKPASTDLVDIAVINGNMDTLDTAVAAKADPAVPLRVVRSSKDAEGIWTTISWYRADTTLAQTSVLSGGTTPEYTTRTVTYYDTDGTTVLDTVAYTLAYDVDGDFESEVFA